MIYWFLFLVIIPIVEIVILIKMGAILGVINMILIILLTGYCGAILARLQGFIIIQQINNSLSRGIMPSQNIIDGALIFVGGVCLVAPGLLGDSIGLLLLIPWTRILIRNSIMLILKIKFDKGQVVTINPIRSYNDPEF